MRTSNVRHIAPLLIVLSSCTTVFAQVRVFMARDGEQGSVATTGDTTLSMAPGATVDVSVWVDDGVQAQELAAYQVFVRWEAVPQTGAAGLVDYVDVPEHRCNWLNSAFPGEVCDPGDTMACGGAPSDCQLAFGGSQQVERNHVDYVYAGLTPAVPVFNETPIGAVPLEESGFGVVGMASAAGTDSVVVNGMRYLSEFSISASEDAFGEHVLSFVPQGSLPVGGTLLIAAGLGDYLVDEVQDLRITVEAICGDGLPQGAEQCDDGNANNNDDCPVTCLTATCGDGLVHNLGSGSEVCDAAGESAGCDPDCTLAVCGDGYRNVTAGEECDDGNTDPADGCTNDCRAVVARSRIFMARDGGEDTAPLTGNTTVFVPAGGSSLVSIWLDATVSAQDLNFYQIVLDWFATPQAGATGTVGYRNNAAPDGAGDSVFVDAAHDRFVFAGEAIDQIVYNESMPLGFAFAGSHADVFGGTPVVGTRYLGEFVLEAAEGPTGEFELSYVPQGSAPVGGTSIGAPAATEYAIDEFQNLTISIATTCGDGIAEGTFVCCDINPGDGIRDDSCCRATCAASGACESIPAVFGDLGGPFAECAPDGFTNIHDKNHALLCFAGVSLCDGFYVDGGGAFGDCRPDGFCNIHDANHALASFGGVNPCTCPPSPAPQMAPSIVGETTLSVRTSGRAKTVQPGETAELRVFSDQPLDALQSYQLHLIPSGGRSGQLELVGIEVENRRDGVFGATAENFTAFNLESGQMLSGLDAGAVETKGAGYLATYTYLVSKDAAGTFVVDVAHGSHDDQTYLIASLTEGIGIVGTTPAAIRVGE